MALDGARKAAMFLAWLGPQAAAKLLREAGQETVTRIAAELACLDASGDNSADGATESAREFLQLLCGARPGGQGVEAFLREMIENVVGQDQTPKILEDVQRRVLQRDPFYQVRSAPIAEIALALKGESAQVISLVLSELPVAKSTELIELLPESVRSPAVRSLTVGEPVPAETRSRVARVVTSRLGGTETAAEAGPEADAHVRRTALILRGLPKALRDQMLADLGEKDPDLRNRVSQMMVVWDDVAKVTDRTLQDALRSVDSRKLALALYEADEAILDKIQRNTSERMRAMLEEESSLLGTPKAEDVEDARGPILAALRDLNEVGELAFEEEDA